MFKVNNRNNESMCLLRSKFRWPRSGVFTVVNSECQSSVSDEFEPVWLDNKDNTKLFLIDQNRIEAKSASDLQFLTPSHKIFIEIYFIPKPLTKRSK